MDFEELTVKKGILELLKESSLLNECKAKRKTTHFTQQTTIYFTLRTFFYVFFYL